MLSTFIVSHKMLVGFFIGIFLGFAFGFVMASLFHASKKADEEMERMEASLNQKKEA